MLFSLIGLILIGFVNYSVEIPISPIRVSKNLPSDSALVHMPRAGAVRKTFGGHICPCQDLFQSISSYVKEHSKYFLIDHYISYTGDDIALVMIHEQGEGDEQIHKLAWEAFITE